MATATERHPPSVYTRPWVYAKQEDALFHGERYGIVEASTKSGKTVGCIIWLLEQAIQGKAGREYWWIAPVYGQTKIAYRRLKRALPEALFDGNESELTITLANGAIIRFKSGEKPDNLYGEDVWAAVIDEASRLREEAWHAIRSTLTATRGSVRIIGNVKGRRNWAYQLARRAEGGEDGMHYAKLTAHDAVEAGVLKAAEVEDAKSVLPDAVYRELYLAEPSDDEGNPFGASAIRACVADLSSDPVAVWGWDLAKEQDWTVGIGLDANGRTAAAHRWQRVPWGETERRIVSLVGGTPAMVDSTGVGDPIVERIQAQCSSVQGMKFTPQSKQQLMEGLAVAIQGVEVSYPDDYTTPQGTPFPIVSELLSFEYAYTRTGVRYSAPEGFHDDTVDALALAVRLRSRPGSTLWDIAGSWGPVEELLK